MLNPHQILMLLVAIILLMIFKEKAGELYDSFDDKTFKKTGSINKPPTKEAQGVADFNNVNARESVAKAVKYLPVSAFHSVSKMPEADIASYINDKLSEHKSLHRFPTQVNKLSRDLAVVLKTNELV